MNNLCIPKNSLFLRLIFMLIAGLAKLEFADIASAEDIKVSGDSYDRMVFAEAGAKSITQNPSDQKAEGFYVLQGVNKFYTDQRQKMIQPTYDDLQRRVTQEIFGKTALASNILGLFDPKLKSIEVRFMV